MGQVSVLGFRHPLLTTMSVDEGQTALLSDIVLDPPPPPMSLELTQPGSFPLASNADTTQDELQQESPTGGMMQQVTLRWLLLVFLVTTLLLVFQVVAGLCTRSLALLTDSAHSLIDVISYGLNFYVEKMKIRSRDRGQDSAMSMRLVAKVDFCGGATSTVALLMATGFAVAEAIARLRAPSLPYEDEKFDSIGIVLLVFAVVSTLANMGILAAFVRWHKKANSLDALLLEADPLPALQSSALPEFHAPPPPPQIASERPPKPKRMRAALLSPVPMLQPIDLENPSSPNTANAVHRRGELASPSGRPREVRRGMRSALNICKDYSRAAESGCGDGCGLDDCNLRGQGQFDLPTCENPACCAVNDTRWHGEWLSMLHMLVHPGCTDSAHLPVTGSDEHQKASDMGNNLNLSAAMLHLIADVVRGITILVSAIIIQAGVVRDAGKADAVCALLVAVFILIGATFIFQRLATSVCLHLRIGSL